MYLMLLLVEICFCFYFIPKRRETRASNLTGSKEVFLTHWTIGFDPDMEISVAPKWVKLPYLPIIFWDESFLKDIRNKQCRLTFRGGKTLNFF